MRKKRKHSPKQRNIHQLDIFDTRKKSLPFKNKKALKRQLKKWSSFLSHTPKQYIYYFLAVCVIAGVYIIYFSQVFSVTEIQIYRKDNISNIEQAYRSVDVFRGKKIYSIEDKNLSLRLQKSQKSLKYITIQKKLPNSLKIHLESYKPLFISENNIILENGSTIESSGRKTSSLPSIYFSGKASGEDPLKHESLQNIKLIGEKLGEMIQNFQILTRIYYTKEEEVLFITRDGAILIFDLSENITHQTEKLALFLQENTDIPQNNIIYIDLRVSGKVYLCSGENEYSCSENIKKLYSELPFTLMKDLSSSENQQ